MRREELYLADLIDNARAVRGYLDGVTRERWDAEDILRDAVLYRMLLLGEIASALPESEPTSLRQAPMAGVRQSSRVSALIPPELRGLPLDDSENALIAGRFRDGGEYAVECLGYD